MDEQDEALRARAEARLGTTLKDKYRLDKVLGIGGMATVFAATHRNQAELAVKLLHTELSLREDLRKRFLREGYVGNSVKHPGAVLVVDDDIADDGSAFLVMELLRGRSLETLWEKNNRRLTSRAVTAIVLQLLEVLAAAHEKAIVHRDLKPANLFLTSDGSLKVLDFGIARLRDAVGGSEHATRTGTLMGTPAFMAPEQAQAVTTEIDALTDLWAVGATMYTLMSGALVHDGNNSSQILIKAGTTAAKPLLAAAPHVEPAIAEVVDRALAFDKSGRWPSAEAMRDALLSAATVAFGKPPGRDDLAELAAPDGGTAQTERAPSQATPRLVVAGTTDVQAGDPTFATPSAQRPSVPVSSGAVRASTALSAPPPLAGMSTANPVSAESPSKPKRAVPVSAIVTGVALLVAGVAVAVAVRGRSVPEGPAAVGLATTAPPPSAPAPSPPPPTAPSAAPVPAASVAASAPPAPPPPQPAPKPLAAHPTSPQPAPPAHAAPKAAPPVVDCTIPYVLNASGDKIWKRECQ